MTRSPTRKSFLMNGTVNRDLLADKLCERLVFERIGLQLYERAIAHRYYEAQVRRMRDFARQERRHAEMAEVLLRELGQDPAIDTPSATIARREAAPLVDLASRGDADVPLLLHALLVAELMDNAGWELLVTLGKEADLEQEWLRSFRLAWREERVHLQVVQRWMAEEQRRELHAAQPWLGGPPA